MKEPNASSAQNIVRKDVKKHVRSFRNECNDGSMRFEKCVEAFQSCSSPLFGDLKEWCFQV